MSTAAPITHSAREVETLQRPADIKDDRLEGQILELLLQLPDEDGEAP